MKKSIVIAVTLLIIASTSLAADLYIRSGSVYAPKYIAETFTELDVYSLYIPCQTRGNVTIDFKDGKVTLTNCTLDEASEAFYLSLQKYFDKACK